MKWLKEHEDQIYDTAGWFAIIAGFVVIMLAFVK